jgi:hypothetical protein
MKFRIVEIKQKVREETKIARAGQKTAEVIQSLANIGRIFGMKTEFLTTMTNLFSSVFSLFKTKKEFTDDEKKVISVLVHGGEEANVIDPFLKSCLGVKDIPTPPTTNPEGAPTTVPEEITPVIKSQVKKKIKKRKPHTSKLGQQLVSALINQGFSNKDAQNKIDKTLRKYPKIKDIKDLISKALNIDKIPKAGK